MNGDLISRSALLAEYDKGHQGPQSGARKLIENAPEALVRCADCKHTEHCEIYAGWDGKNPDWFCADGERKSKDA